MDEDFWEAGFQYKPNQRMDLELAAGERSYGTSFRGNFSYTLRRGSISMTYDEGPTTRGELAFDRRPIIDADNLENNETRERQQSVVRSRTKNMRRRLYAGVGTLAPRRHSGWAQILAKEINRLEKMSFCGPTLILLMSFQIA